MAQSRKQTRAREEGARTRAREEGARTRAREEGARTRARARLRLVHDADAARAAAGAALDPVFFDKSQIRRGVVLINIGAREAGSSWVVVGITTHELGRSVGTIVEGVPTREVRYLSDMVTLRKGGEGTVRTLSFGALKYSAIWQLPQ